MSKIKKEFKFETPIFYKEKVLAEATISGKGYYDWANTGYYDYCYADIIDVCVRLKLNGYEQDVTFAYIVDKGLLGSFADAIDKAIHAHMEYIFSPEYAVIATATHDGTATVVEPVPCNLKGINGDTQIVCNTNQERTAVIDILKSSGLKYGITNLPIESFKEYPDVWIEYPTLKWWDCAQSRDTPDVIYIPAAQFLSLNAETTNENNPTTHGSNV